MTKVINDYIEANYARKSLTLATLSNDLGFENSYLRKVYKATTSKTITQKIEEVRMEEAKKLLCSGQFYGKEVSEMVGFSDPFYFSKRFKQVFQISPTEFQKKIRNKQDFF